MLVNVFLTDFRCSLVCSTKRETIELQTAASEHPDLEDGRDPQLVGENCRTPFERSSGL